MTTDAEQLAQELLSRNGQVANPNEVRLATVRPDSPRGRPQLDFESPENPIAVREVALDQPLVISKVVTVAVSTTQYTANDCVGDVMVWDLGDGGLIQTATLSEDSDTPQNASMDLYLFDRDISTIDTTDNNDAWDPGDGVWAFFIGSIPITSYPSAVAANGGGATARGVGIAYAGKVYGRLATSGTPTYAVGGVRLRLSALVR